MKRNTVWAIGITLAAVGLAAACGNSVSDSGNSGGGNGGKAGTGGSPSTSTVVQTGGAPGTGGSTSNGGAPGTGGSLGTGGGDVCQQACDHAAACGEDICSQIPNFSCDNPQYACIAGCANGASCADIQQAVNFVVTMMGDPGPVGVCILSTCQNAGTGGAGPGSGGASSSGSGTGAGGAPSAQACLTCAEGKCGQQALACNNDASPGGCKEWLGCVQTCNFDTACTAGCDSQFPNAKGRYDALYACACTSCPNRCADINPCGMHPAGN